MPKDNLCYFAEEHNSIYENVINFECEGSNCKCVCVLETIRR